MPGVAAKDKTAPDRGIGNVGEGSAINRDLQNATIKGCDGVCLFQIVVVPEGHLRRAIIGKNWRVEPVIQKIARIHRVGRVWRAIRRRGRRSRIRGDPEWETSEIHVLSSRPPRWQRRWCDAVKVLVQHQDLHSQGECEGNGPEVGSSILQLECRRNVSAAGACVPECEVSPYRVTGSNSAIVLGRGYRYNVAT